MTIKEVMPLDEKSVDVVSNFTGKGEERASMFRVAHRNEVWNRGRHRSKMGWWYEVAMASSVIDTVANYSKSRKATAVAYLRYRFSTIREPQAFEDLLDKREVEEWLSWLSVREI